MAERKTPNKGYQKLKSDLSAGNIGQVYIFYGEESYLREYYLGEIKKKLVPAGFEEFNYHRLSGKTLTMQELNEAVEAMPMMAERTLIVVTDCDLFKLPEEQRTALIALLNDFPPYCCLVFVYDLIEYKPSKTYKKLYEALDKNAQSVKFEAQDRSDLINWIGRRFRALGKGREDAGQAPGSVTLALRRFKPIQLIFTFIISVLRGTPLMLQLMVVYFGPYFIFGIRISMGYSLIAVFIAFECMASKYMTYTFPYMMPLAILMGQYFAEHAKLFARMAAGMALVYFALLVAILPVVMPMDSGRDTAAALKRMVTPQTEVLTYGVRYPVSISYYSGLVPKRLVPTEEDIEKARPQKMSWTATNIMPFASIEKLDLSRATIILTDFDNRGKLGKDVPGFWQEVAETDAYCIYQLVPGREDGREDMATGRTGAKSDVVRNWPKVLLERWSGARE